MDSKQSRQINYVFELIFETKDFIELGSISVPAVVSPRNDATTPS